MSKIKHINNPLDMKEFKTILQELDEKHKSVEINIHIENVNLNIKNIQDIPLTLNFDKVEVQKNSGHINFGNNFNTTKNEHQKENIDQIVEPSEIEDDEDIVVKVNDRIVDYYYKRS